MRIVVVEEWLSVTGLLRARPVLFLSDDEDEEKRVVRSQKDKRFASACLLVSGLSVKAPNLFTDLMNSKTLFVL